MRFLLCLFLIPIVAHAAEVDFSHEIIPLLKQQCGKCHTGSQKKGGFSLNTRESLLVGGESGPAVVAGNSQMSELVKRLTSRDESLQMPPEGERLTAAQVAIVTRWIDEGLKWEAGFAFGPRVYEPPLKPRRPELPPASAGRTHPLDRILDSYLAEHKLPRPQPMDDAVFVRRVYLDLIGLLPTPEESQAFMNDQASDKRARLVRELLNRKVDYAEHWLTFWNDLLRNDYAGTGFITGGRKQISKWLYESLVANKPYDQLARELIAPPTPESSGFGDGIRWRGEVSAGQTVEIQFAQSVGQAFLGINLKCASCHDSFIDRWTLEESYGLAAIYSQRPLELHRCDKPLGKQAKPAWLFSELGQVDAKAPQPERLQQLATLMTHAENGRFTRTMVNRLWHRLMGRGIVHPTDAMQTEPWNHDLLDYLASDLAERKYDLQGTLELIATSQAYQSRCEVVTKDTDTPGYRYAGPRAKRLTAEQFLDCVWQITDSAPTKFDAPVIRGDVKSAASLERPLSAQWIWTQADVSQIPAGETRTFRKTWELQSVPTQAIAVITCDNSYTLFVNGKRAQAGEHWEAPDLVSIASLLRAGKNEIVVVAINGGIGPNPAGLFLEARWRDAQDQPVSLGSDASWEWTASLPDKKGKFTKAPGDWKPAASVTHQNIWMASAASKLAESLARGTSGSGLMVRAGLLKSDFLMRSLGRPNRDQIVSVRPLELTTLEAIDLSNGEILAKVLRNGAKRIVAKDAQSPEEFIRWIYSFALSREPSPNELRTLAEAVGPTLTENAVEDVLWTVIMLPEFQFVR